MNQTFSQIERIISEDPGNRGVGGLVVPGDLETACRSLFVEGKRVAIITGFFIQVAGAAETDGPPGALALGTALQTLGRDVLYITDPFCVSALQTGGLSPLVMDDGSTVERTVSEFDPTHDVAIERPGRAADGKFYNMRGVDISAWTSELDRPFLIRRPDRRYVTIGIGDGGNEIGMGKVGDRIATSVANGARIASIVATDVLITAGVSNWGAWGITAGLSFLANRPLLPSPAEAAEHLRHFVAAGCVDGVTGRAAETVDGLPWAVHASILSRLAVVVSDTLVDRQAAEMKEQYDDRLRQSVERGA